MVIYSTANNSIATDKPELATEIILTKEQTTVIHIKIAQAA